MVDCAWAVGGDFNVFADYSEREGSNSDRTGEMSDFVHWISACELLDVGFDGSPFTWERSGVRERLDRILFNEGWGHVFALVRVTHLPRLVSDHSPLLIRAKFSATTRPSSFRFQSMWVRHPTFLDLVRQVWGQDTGAMGMRCLQIKLGRMKKALKSWNWHTFGNIFHRLQQAQQAH